MTVIVRLLLLFMIALSGQSLAFHLTDAGIYSYDGFPNVSDKQYAPLRFQNSGYDALQNFADAPGQEIRLESFFSSDDGFLVTKGGPIWSTTKSKSAVENAFGHWSKHKSEFPELQNAKQYAERAKDFLTNPPKGALTKTNSRGDTLRYDPGTNTFGVLGKDGAPRTMFRPKDGMDYWNRQ